MKDQRSVFILFWINFININLMKKGNEGGVRIVLYIVRKKFFEIHSIRELNRKKDIRYLFRIVRAYLGDFLINGFVQA